MSKGEYRTPLLFFVIFILAGSWLFSNGILNGNGAEPKFFSLDRFGGALILQYQYTDELYESDDQILNDISRNYFESGLQLNMSGSIYHPGLLTFNVDFKILSYRSKEVYFSDAATNNDVNDTYNINLSFLNKRKLNFRIFAIKDYLSADRRFSDRYYVKTEKYGAAVANTSKLFPFRVTVFRLKQLSQSISFLERDEKTDNVEMDMKLRDTEHMKSNYRFRWKDYAEAVYGTNYTSLDMIADWFFFYGKKKKNLVSSLLSFRKMTSTFAIETIHLNSSARHYIRENFYAAGQFSILNNSYTNSKNTTSEFRLQVGHRLFDSLESELSGGVNLQRSDLQDFNRIHTGIRLNYRKKIPTGSLSANYVFRVTDGDYISQNGISENSRLVRFDLSDSVVLHIYGIRPSSIRVTNADLSQLYVEGIDYEVDTDEISVIITRIPGGNIPSGSSILVTYEFLPAPDYKSNLKYSNIGVSLNFLKYFRVYYRDEQNDQDIRSDYLVLPFEEFRKELVGFSLNSRWVSGAVYRENYLSSKTGYTTLHYSVSTRIRPLRKMGLTASWSINDVEYTEGGLFGKFTALLGEINYIPARNLNTRLLYRRFRYETKSSDRFRESLILRLNWTIRKIVLNIYYERILNSFGLSRDQRDLFSISIRRNF